MNWKSILFMGGYALYVWGSYILSAAAIATEITLLRRRSRAGDQLLMKSRNGTRV